MSKGGMDTFALVINYLMIFGPLCMLLLVHKIRWLPMVGQLYTSSEKYDLMNYVIAFVKD
jgi:hypothetical protein